MRSTHFSSERSGSTEPSLHSHRVHRVDRGGEASVLVRPNVDRGDPLVDFAQWSLGGRTVYYKAHYPDDRRFFFFGWDQGE